MQSPVPAFLILSQGGEQKGFYPLDPERETLLGRASDNTVVLYDDRASRYHASVFHRDGDWFIQDKGSRNGTGFDDQVLRGTQAALYSGCRLQIGHSVILFGCGDPTSDETEAAAPSGRSDAGNGGRTGVFGINRELLRGPRQDDFLPKTIVHRTGTSFLKPESGAKRQARETRCGHGSAELCRLAYNLGKAEEIDQVAKLALEGLLDATGADAAGLWLFPYHPSAERAASDIRLVANASVQEHLYAPISESLVRAVSERKEAILVNEPHRLADGDSIDKSPSSAPSMKTPSREKNVFHEGGAFNNALAAPIRHRQGILGLIHLYTTRDEVNLDLCDLEYTLAVADTVAVAIAHVHKQKELTANLHLARKENSALREILKMESEIIGISPPMKMIGHLVSRAAEGKATLLIRGESGVGKELVARAVCLASPRNTKPLVCINCAAISESLLASELFGHEKGAFTGATDRKIGKFEAAHSGTLFLDEIGEMSPALQAKFLRVLEGHPFERVGGNTPISVDVRVIAATNRDLEKEVEAGRFRHDLFFRLRVLEIVIPPLRKRLEDIPILADYFLDKFSRETGRKYQGFSPEAMRVLMSYGWPGNIRELKNVVERAVVLGGGPWIQEGDLLLTSLKTTGESDIGKVSASDIFVPLSLDDVERNHILRTLDHLHWNKSLAAKQLGIERTTLDRKIKRYGLEKSREDER